MANRARSDLILAGMMILGLMAVPVGGVRAEAAPGAAKMPKAADTGSGKPAVSPAEPKSSPRNAPVETGSKDAPLKPESATVQPAPTVDTAKSVKSEKPARSKHRARSGDAAADAKVGQGPSPASPPPLTMNGLREEIHRETVPVSIDADAPPRTKVEQMLTEITKARQALHEDTIRLEGMMAQDGSEPAAAGAAGSGPAPAGGRPAAKNPLDILAKALRGIKPDQAAPIVSRLDKRLAATVLQRMPPVDAGKIMGAMKPDTAAELATQIAMRVMPSEVKR